VSLGLQVPGFSLTTAWLAPVWTVGRPYRCGNCTAVVVAYQLQRSMTAPGTVDVGTANKTALTVTCC